MSASSLTIRLDQDLKESAAEVAESSGVDLSTVVRAFFTEMVYAHSRWITGSLMPKASKPSRKQRR